MEKVIIELQESISHQSEDISRLSAELYTQQKEIEMLHNKIDKIYAKLKAVSDNSDIRPVNEETAPPHY